MFGTHVSHTSYPCLMKKALSERYGNFFFPTITTTPFVPATSSSHVFNNSRPYPCPLNDPATHRQLIKVYPSASIGTQAYSAGKYSMKTFPRTFSLTNCNPSSIRHANHPFLASTPSALFLSDIAQQICSCPIFSRVKITLSIFLFCR